MNTLKPKNSKSITFTVIGFFFTIWAILAHSAAAAYTETPALLLLYFSQENIH